MLTSQALSHLDCLKVVPESSSLVPLPPLVGLPRLDLHPGRRAKVFKEEETDFPRTWEIPGANLWMASR